MSTRREFLEGGLVAATALMGPIPAFAAEAPVVPLYAAIYDVRFAASRSFAAEAHLRGTSVKGIRGQVHDLWHDDLYHHWNAQPMALAGMTTHEALFLLAMMGRDAGMRVVHRIHHTPASDGRSAQHAAFGPQEMLGSQLALGGPERLWGRSAARIVTQWPGSSVAVGAGRSTIDQAHSHAIGRDALVTWLMVPASRNA